MSVDDPSGDFSPLLDASSPPSTGAGGARVTRLSLPRVRHGASDPPPVMSRAVKRHDSDGGDDDDGASEATTGTIMSPPPSRSVSVMQLACLGFMVVSSGPFGLEAAVSAAGFGPVFLAVLLLPWIWALPQALTMAELATMMIFALDQRRGAHP